MGVARSLTIFTSMKPGCLAAAGLKTPLKCFRIARSLAGSTLRSTCNWIGLSAPAPRAPAAVAASIALKYVRRFICPPSRLLIEFLLAGHSELDAIQPGLSRHVERFAVIPPA